MRNAVSRFGRRVGPDSILLGHISVQTTERYLGCKQRIRGAVNEFWHQSGTAKMGRDEMSVVDGQLKVYGVDSLRVSDASILSRVTTGNTMAPSVVIGEQAAAFLTRVGSGDEAFHSGLEETME